MAGFWYSLACVVVPCLIGAVMYVGFELWDRSRRRVKSNDGLPTIDYII
jgi:hypothetical protein